MSILHTMHEKRQMQARTEHTDTFRMQLKAGGEDSEGREDENDEGAWRDNDGKTSLARSSRCLRY